MKKVVFEGYNVGYDTPGARNFPTWAVQTWAQDNEVNWSVDEIKAELDRYLNGRSQAHWVTGIVTEWLLNAAARVDWGLVDTALKSDRFELEPDEVTDVAYKVLSSSGVMVTDRRQCLESHFYTWGSTRRARQVSSYLNQYARQLVNIYLNAVQWDQVEEFLNG